MWLNKVLRRLPEVGVQVGTLAGARRDGYVGEPVDLPASSWGSGKDWRVERSAGAAPRATERRGRRDRARHRRQAAGRCADRDRVADQIVRETLMTVQSDWPFMVSRTPPPDMPLSIAPTNTPTPRARSATPPHAAGTSRQTRLAENWSRADNLFARIDARRLFSEGLLSDETALSRQPEQPPMGRPTHAGVDGVVEYPPVIVGGLGCHVHHLAVDLAGLGHDVTVITRRPSGTDSLTHPHHRFSRRRGAGDRHRRGSARVPIRHRHDVVDAGDGPFVRCAGLRILAGDPETAWVPDVVHAHDWLVAHPAITLRRVLRRAAGGHDPRHRGGPAQRLGQRLLPTGRCIRWNGGWPTRPTPSSPVRSRCVTR